MRRNLRPGLATLLGVGFLLAGAIPTLAGHGAERSGDDPCNGTDGFNINNVTTRDVVDAIAAQNEGSLSADGTVDRQQITHAHLGASGHTALQVREGAVPFDRVIFEFARADGSWSFNSTNNPGYVTAIESREDEARDIDGDNVLGETFVFFIPTDVVSDGTYVARLRASNDDSEVGRLCLDATVSNGQGPLDMPSANQDPSYEPGEDPAADVFAPQPVLWFPAGEPSAAQQADYGAKELRIEFVESLAEGSLKVEREENLPAPTGLAGTASTEGGSLETGTYFYVVSALNATGETLPSNEISLDVTGPTGSVALTWDAVSEATEYRVYRGTAYGAQDVFYTSTTNSFVDTGAEGTAGTPDPDTRAKIWIDYTSLLEPDDFQRPHFLAGGRMDETFLESFANEKVWGPGFRFAFGSLADEALPSERIRIDAADAAGKTFCGIYSFSAGPNDSFLASSPSDC